MEKVRPWCGQPSDRGRLKNRTDGGAFQTFITLSTKNFCLMLELCARLKQFRRLYLRYDTIRDAILTCARKPT